MAMQAVSWLGNALGIDITGSAAVQHKQPAPSSSPSSPALVDGSDTLLSAPAVSTMMPQTKSTDNSDAFSNKVDSFFSAISSTFVGGGSSSSSSGGSGGANALLAASAHCAPLDGSQPLQQQPPQPSQPQAHKRDANGIEYDHNGLPLERNLFVFNPVTDRYEPAPNAPQSVKDEWQEKLRKLEEEKVNGGKKYVAPPPPPKMPPGGMNNNNINNSNLMFGKKTMLPSPITSTTATTTSLPGSGIGSPAISYHGGPAPANSAFHMMSGAGGGGRIAVAGAPTTTVPSSPMYANHGFFDGLPETTTAAAATTVTSAAAPAPVVPPPAVMLGQTQASRPPLNAGAGGGGSAPVAPFFATTMKKLPASPLHQLQQPVKPFVPVGFHQQPPTGPPPPPPPAGFAPLPRFQAGPVS